MNSMVNLTRASLRTNLARMRESVAASGVPTHKYLSFHAQRAEYYTKDGDNEVSIPIGTKFAVNWQNVTHGYVCWKGGKPHDYVAWPYGDKMLDIDELPDHGPYEQDANGRKDGWREQVSIPMKDIKTGIEYIYKTGPDSSVKAANALLRDLITEIGLRLPPGDDDAAMTDIPVPVITNGKTHFVPKGRTNKVFVPKWAIEKDWLAPGSITLAPLKGPAPGVFSLAAAQGAQSALVSDNVTDVEINE